MSIWLPWVPKKTRGGGVAEVQALHERRELVADVVVGGVGIGLDGGRTRPVGGVGAGLDQRHPDAEAGDLLASDSVSPSRAHLEAW